MDDINKIRPIIYELDSGDYTVPSDSILIITGGYHTGSTGYIKINDKNIGEANPMELPIIANKNDIISYSGNPSSVKFRGYLVEDGYFSNEITTTNNNQSTNFYPPPNSSYLPLI